MTAESVRGRVFLVTGANSGIGRATAAELARGGGRVILACRSRERATPVLQALRSESGNDAVELLELDLASFASIRQAADVLLKRDMPLHGLINNAGVVARGRTADGFELIFGVNHLGHFLLTQLLLDRLRASAPARVVTVASRAHRRVERIDYEAVRRPTASLTGFPEYGVSKLANVLFSAELGRRLAGSRVTTYAVHPGVIATEIWRRIPWPVRTIFTSFMRTPEQGAAVTLACATRAERAAETGLYYDDDGQAVPPSPAARDPQLAAELWQRSLEFCGL